MIVKVNNPIKYRICGGGIILGYELSKEGYNVEQVEDMIRRMLLERSIIADKIEVIK